MSYKDYHGLGREWLKPILDLEALEKDPKKTDKPRSAKQKSRCDKTIDMFDLLMED